MEILYSIYMFIALVLGIYIGLKLPFISDKLGKKIEVVAINENNNVSKSLDNDLTPDIIDEWQNGLTDGDK